MAIKRKKSAWEEARDFLAQSASNVFKGATQTVNNVQQQTGTFYDAFKRDLENFNRTNEARERQNQQNVNNLVSRVLKGSQQAIDTTQDAGRNAFDYFNPTKDVSDKPGVQNLWTSRPMRVAQPTLLKMQRGSEKILDVPGAKGAARTAVGIANAGTELLDFTTDFAEQHPLISSAIPGLKPVGDTARLQRELGQTPLTQQLKEGVDKVEALEYLQPSKEWQKASFKEKITKHPGETIAVIAPSVISSMAPYFVNPALGVSMMFGSTANQIKDDAVKNGMDEQQAELLAIGTAAAVSVIDKLGMDKLLGPAKNQFYASFAQRLSGIIRSGLLEGGTEVGQEHIQMAAELAFKDIGADEYLTRTGMAFIGGFGGGTGVRTITETATALSEKPSTTTPPQPLVTNPVQTQFRTAAEPTAGTELSSTKTFNPDEKLTGDLYRIFNDEYKETQEALDIDPELIQDLPQDITGREALERFDLPVAGVGQEGAANIAERLKAEGYSPSVAEPALNGTTQEPQDAKEMFLQDMEQELAKEEEAPQLTPEDEFDTTTALVQEQIKGVFSEQDLQVLGVKEVFDEKGNPAWGKVTTSPGKIVIEVVEQDGKVQSKTAWHEALHAYINLQADPETYKGAIQEYQEQHSLTEADAQERLADDFADFVAGRQTFTGHISAFFHDLLLNIRSFMGRVNNAELLFTAAAQGKNQGGVGQQVTPEGEQTPATAPAFREMDANLFGEVEQNLTSQVLERLPQKEVISATTIKQELNKPGIQGLERFIIETAIEKTEQNGKVNRDAFFKEVKKNLLPLRVQAVEEPLYNVDGHPMFDGRLPADVRDPGAIYKEAIYSSPINNLAQNQHFGQTEQDFPQYFAHVRYEELPDGTRQILEIQSDLTQKNWLKETIIGTRSDVAMEMLVDDMISEGPVTDERAKQAIEEFGMDSAHGYLLQNLITIKNEEIAGGAAVDVAAQEKAAFETILRNLPKTPSTKEQIGLEGYKDTKIMAKRMIQEEIRRAAQDGKTRLLIPTGDTAIRIEDKDLDRKGGIIPVGDVPAGREINYYGKPSVIVDADQNTLTLLPYKRTISYDKAVANLKEEIVQNIEQTPEAYQDLLTNYRENFPSAPAKVSSQDLAHWEIYSSLAAGGDIEQSMINRIFGETDDFVAFDKGAFIIAEAGEAPITVKRGELLTNEPLKNKVSHKSYERIYDLYEKELTSVLSRIGKESAVITDPQGVTWREVTITPEDATRPIVAFRRKAGRPNVPNPEDFPRRPGELNVNNLDLNKKRKKDIYEDNKRDDVTPLTEKEVLEYANRIGLDMKSLSQEQVKKIAAKQLNVRRRVVELDKQIEALKKKGAPLEQIQNLTRERREVSQLSAMQGRSQAQLTRMRQIMADEINTPMNSIFQAFEQLGIEPEKYLDRSATVDFNDADQVIAFWREVVPANFGMWFDKLRYNAMLSSPSTHLVNMASNLQGASLLTPISMEIEALVDTAAHVLSGGRHERTRAFGEGVAYTGAFWGGQKQAIKNAFNILLKGDLRFRLQQDDGPIDINNFNPLMVPLARKGGKIPFRFQKTAEALLDTPSKFLSAEDQMTMTPAQRGMQAALKHRQSKGLKVKNLEKEAEKRALRTIFRGDLVDPEEGIVLRAIGEVGNFLKKGANSDNPAVRWPVKMSIPFINIGTNLAKQGFEANPVTGAINLIGNRNKVSSVSKMVMGGAFTLAAMALADKGLLIGAEDEDKTKRDQGRAAGKLPWSIKIGDVYVQYNKMHPVIAFQLGMVAAINDALRANKLNEDKGQAIMDSIAKTLAYFNDQTYWRNVGDFVNVMNGDPYAVSSLVSNYPSQMIPFRAAMSYATRIIDEYQHAPEPDAALIPAVMQRIMAGIPGLSDNVPTRKDPYGADMKWNMRHENLISPYRLSRENPEHMRIYNKMLDRADVNKMLRMQGDEEKEALGTDKLTTPEEKMRQKELDLDKEINRGRIKLGQKGVEDVNGQVAGKSTGKIGESIFQWANEDGEVQTVDLSQYKKKRGGTLEQYEQRKDMYSDARKIWGSNLSPEEKQAAFDYLGLDRDEVRYDYMASFNNPGKTEDILKKLTGQPHDIVIERLLTGRVESLSGEIYAANGVLDDLADAGLISEAEAAWLKKIKYTKDSEGNLTQKGSGSGSGSTSGLSLNIKAPNVPVARLKLSAQPGRRINFAPPQGTPFKAPEVPKMKVKVEAPSGRLKIAPYKSTMAKTLSGLGRS